MERKNVLKIGTGNRLEHAAVVPPGRVRGSGCGSISYQIEVNVDGGHRLGTEHMTNRAAL